VDPLEKPNIKVLDFTGPLDLLLTLIEENKMDICDIQVSEIADQYLAVLKEMEEMDLDIASDFLVMATVLIDLKLKVLFPRHVYNAKWSTDLTEDPREALIERLLEYKLFRDAAGILRERESVEEKFYSKTTVSREYEHLKHTETPVTFDLEFLKDLYQDLMEEYEQSQDSLGGFHIARPKLSQRYARELILTNLDLEGGSLEFTRLLRRRPKIEIILLLLSLLDLYKVGVVDIHQEERFGSLWLRKV